METKQRFREIDENWSGKEEEGKNGKIKPTNDIQTLRANNLNLCLTDFFLANLCLPLHCIHFKVIAM